MILTGAGSIPMGSADGVGHPSLGTPGAHTVSSRNTLGISMTTKKWSTEEVQARLLGPESCQGKAGSRLQA